MSQLLPGRPGTVITRQSHHAGVQQQQQRQAAPAATAGRRHWHRMRAAGGDAEAPAAGGGGDSDEAAKSVKTRKSVDVTRRLPGKGYFAIADTNAEVYSKAGEKFDPTARPGRYKSDFIWNSNWQETLKIQEQLEAQRKEYERKKEAGEISDGDGFLNMSRMSALDDMDVDLTPLLMRKKDPAAPAVGAGSSSSAAAAAAGSSSRSRSGGQPKPVVKRLRKTASDLPTRECSALPVRRRRSVPPPPPPCPPPIGHRPGRMLALPAAQGLWPAAALRPLAPHPRSEASNRRLPTATTTTNRPPPPPSCPRSPRDQALHARARRRRAQRPPRRPPGPHRARRGAGAGQGVRARASSPPAPRPCMRAAGRGARALATCALST
jgi:hypothetical protein